MLYLFKKIFSIFCIVFILNIQFSYCDDFDIYIFERIYDFNNNFNETVYFDNYYQYESNIYQDIQGCCLLNYLVNKKFFYLFNFFFFLGCFYCGIIGFFWLLLAYNYIYTSGVIDHD